MRSGRAEPECVLPRTGAPRQLIGMLLSLVQRYPCWSFRVLKAETLSSSPVYLFVEAGDFAFKISELILQAGELFLNCLKTLTHFQSQFGDRDFFFLFEWRVHGLCVLPTIITSPMDTIILIPRHL